MAVALRLACKAGSATLTTVPSMKTMLDPRIVAARIQRRCALVHGVALLFAEITPSSHGGRRMFIELRRHRLACVSKVEQELSQRNGWLHKKTPPANRERRLLLIEDGPLNLLATASGSVTTLVPNPHGKAAAVVAVV